MSIKLTFIFIWLYPLKVYFFFYFLCSLCKMLHFRTVFNHMVKINKISEGRLRRHQPNHLDLHVAHFKDNVRKLIMLIKHLGFLFTNCWVGICVNAVISRVNSRWLDASWAQKTLLFRNLSVVVKQNRVLTSKINHREIINNSLTMTYNKAAC